jgi:putative phage-type endonuclease
MTGKPQDDVFVNQAMQHGTDTEPFARAAYETKYGLMVDQCGLVLHPSIERGASSPDGLVGDGLIEIKCPKTATHLDYLLAGVAPSKYQLQMLWQMACTERAWCDFVSFDPRLPKDLQMLCVRFERDDKRIKEIEAEVVKFLSEVDAMIEQLMTRKAA